MESTDRSRLLLLIIRWLARVWGGLAAAFLIFMIVAHLVSSGGWGWPSGVDGIAFVFFPVGVAVGLVIAMKWDALGGLITLVSMITWHVIMNSTRGNPHIAPMIDGLAAPSVLFLAVWLLGRRNPLGAGETRDDS
jgi:hypothetical protein